MGKVQIYVFLNYLCGVCFVKLLVIKLKKKKLKKKQPGGRRQIVQSFCVIMVEQLRSG